MNAQGKWRVLFTMAVGLLATVALASLVCATPALADEPVTQIVYVDADAAAGGNGRSWATAYCYLQDALDQANAHGSNRYEIWVAEGVYFPDEDSDGDHSSNDAYGSFRLSYNNTQLYGGFAGGKTAREQRDWEANVTVRSSDIDGNDITDAHGVVTATNHITGSNAHHVLWLDGETKEPITSTTVIDGFTISAGQADRWIEDDAGGGMYCAGSGRNTVGRDVACSPTLTHVTFSGNRADYDGALYSSGHRGFSSPQLNEVVFSGNSAGRGGAICNYAIGCDGTSSPTLINVILWGNSAAESGDHMYNTSRATPSIGYSLVQGGWDGAGIHNAPGNVTELGGNPRFVDIPTVPDTGSGTPPIVDVGAYEVQNRVYLPLVLRSCP